MGLSICGIVIRYMGPHGHPTMNGIPNIMALKKGLNLHHLPSGLGFKAHKLPVWLYQPRMLGFAWWIPVRNLVKAMDLGEKREVSPGIVV